VGSREATPRQIRGIDSQVPSQTHRPHPAVEYRRVRFGCRYCSHGRESSDGVYCGSGDCDRRALQRSITYVDEEWRQCGQRDT